MGSKSSMSLRHLAGFTAEPGPAIYNVTRATLIARIPYAAPAWWGLGHAFISSRLDYCNSLLYDIGDGLVKKLQAVQNSAARVVTGTRKYDHITPVLRDLHWLPVRHRIDFKVTMSVFKCIDGLAPQYLAYDCVLASTDDICGPLTPRKHQETAGAADKDRHRHQGLCSRCCYCMEQTTS